MLLQRTQVWVPAPIQLTIVCKSSSRGFNALFWHKVNKFLFKCRTLALVSFCAFDTDTDYLWFQFIWAKRPQTIGWNHTEHLSLQTMLRALHLHSSTLAWNWRILGLAAWNSCPEQTTRNMGVVLIAPQTSQFPWLLDPGGLLHSCCLSSAFTVLSWPCLACISQAPLWLLPHTASLLSGMSLFLQGHLPHQLLRI